MAMHNTVKVAFITGICSVIVGIVGTLGVVYSKSAPVVVIINGEQKSVEPSEYQQIINNFDSENETLSKDKTELQTENEDLKNSLESQANTFEDEIFALKQQNEQFQREMADKDSEITALRQENKSLEEEIIKLGGNKPPLEGTFVYFEDMKTFLDDTESFWESITSFVSNIGTSYQHGIWIPNESYYSNFTLDKTYLLNSQYSGFTAVIVVNEYWTSKGKNEDIGEVSIFADDVKIFSSGSIPSDMIEPVKVVLDLNDVTKLQIKSTSYYGYYGILDAKFIIK